MAELSWAPNLNWLLTENKYPLGMKFTWQEFCLPSIRSVPEGYP